MKKVTFLLVVLLCLLGQAMAATAPTPMPEYAQQEFLGNLGVAALVLAVLGFSGLLIATANKINLHYGVGDIYLGAPVSLICWLGVAWLFYMGHRGDDLLPYLEARLWCAGAMVVVPVVYSFIMVRRCNPERGFLALFWGTMGRLFADMLYQLCSLLMFICTILLVIVARRSSAGRGNVLNSLLTLLGIGFLSKCVWDTIRSTTYEPMTGQGYLISFLHMICFGGAIYGVYAYVQHNPQKEPAALVEAVEANNPGKALELMAKNPMMSLEPAIREAVDECNYKMLNYIVRGPVEFDMAMSRARNEELDAVVRFLEEKKRLSDATSSAGK